MLLSRTEGDKQPLGGAEESIAELSDLNRSNRSLQRLLNRDLSKQVFLNR